MFIVFFLKKINHTSQTTPAHPAVRMNSMMLKRSTLLAFWTTSVTYTVDTNPSSRTVSSTRSSSIP